jgi:poly-gamma-glutamate synthesis protein (capsule biosynthesis protein)
LVVGAHPHVIQGIEVYNGRNIVYSLGNFAYGGHANPEDMDTFIFQQTFTFIDGVMQDDNEFNIIPAYISSVRGRNNYQPMPVEGAEAERILGRLERFSSLIGN